MTLKMNAKDAVKWEVVPEIDGAQEVIMAVYKAHGADAVCTSAHDGNHSSRSAHHQDDPKALSEAIDLRITTLFKKIDLYSTSKWYKAILGFAEELLQDLTIHKGRKNEPGVFSVVLERDHIHLEHTKQGKAANIKGWKGPGVYPTAEVRGYMEAKT